MSTKEEREKIAFCWDRTNEQLGLFSVKPRGKKQSRDWAAGRVNVLAGAGTLAGIESANRELEKAASDDNYEHSDIDRRCADLHKKLLDELDSAVMTARSLRNQHGGDGRLRAKHVADGLEYETVPTLAYAQVTKLEIAIETAKGAKYVRSFAEGVPPQLKITEEVLKQLEEALTKELGDAPQSIDDLCSALGNAGVTATELCNALKDADYQYAPRNKLRITKAFIFDHDDTEADLLLQKLGTYFKSGRGDRVDIERLSEFIRCFMEFKAENIRLPVDYIRPEHLASVLFCDALQNARFLRIAGVNRDDLPNATKGERGRIFQQAKHILAETARFFT